MTEFSLFALLIFVALVIGWVIGRFTGRKFSQDKIGNLNLHNDYFRGLNYVINEQPDKAIEIFIKMLEVDSETVETHLALGNLFRRRGEVDRAIRIHQNLIARPTLNHEQRSQAMLELGMDYMSSGLFDRAENLLLGLTEKGIHLKEAYKNLIQIYQQEKDWERAITMSRQLEYSDGSKRGTVIAHYYCEQAILLQQSGKMNEFHDRINRALGSDPSCVRASLMQATQRLKEGKTRLALKSLQRIEKQDPEFLAETIELFGEVYQQMDNREDYIRELQHMIDDYGVLAAMFKLADIYTDQKKHAEALELISHQLSRYPTVSGVDRMLQMTLEYQTGGSNSSSLVAIKQMTENLLEQQPAYQCRQCGFEAKLMHWQCPSCKEWNTIKPLQVLASE